MQSGKNACRCLTITWGLGCYIVRPGGRHGQLLLFWGRCCADVAERHAGFGNASMMLQPLQQYHLQCHAHSMHSGVIDARLLA